MTFALKHPSANSFMSKRDCWISPAVQGDAYCSKNARTYKSIKAAEKGASEFKDKVIISEVSW